MKTLTPKEIAQFTVHATRHSEVARNTIEEMIKDLINQSKWISVKEKYPTHGVQVLVTDGKTTGIDTRDFASRTGFELSFIYPVTHWQPLPERPKL